MNTDLVIGIDCSTTSCKAIVWNLKGKRVAEGRSQLDVLTPAPLWHEQPAHTWWRGTVNALQEVLQQVNLERLSAICITHQRETFVPVGADGEPLRNAILWMDERAGDQLGYLDEKFGKERFHQLTGKPLSGNLSVAKIAWLQKNEPEVFLKTHKFLDVHAFLVHKLTGLFCTSWGCADPMGVFDMVKIDWAVDLLQNISLSLDRFPDAFAPGQVIGEVTLKASKECGLPEGLPVVAGIGDGQSAGLGSNVTHSKTAYLSLGTSVVSGYYAPTYQISRNFRTMYSGIGDTYFLETVILGGAYTISWFINRVLREHIQNFKDDHITEQNLEDAAKDVTAGADGLLLVPYWNSAMNPYWDSNASGVIVGLRGIHGRGHIYRAILEGIAFEQRLHTNGVESKLVDEVETFIVGGGGANSDLWCQIIADITGKTVQRVLEREASALGAGVLAASAMNLYSDVQEAANEMVHVEEDYFEPQEKQHQLYTRLYEDVYRHIYPALRKQLGILTDY